MIKRAYLLGLLLLVVGPMLAQRNGIGVRRNFGGAMDDGMGWTRGEGGTMIGPDNRTPREVSAHSGDTPMWTNPHGFEADTFTFVRVRRGRAGYGP